MPARSFSSALLLLVVAVVLRSCTVRLRTFFHVRLPLIMLSPVSLTPYFKALPKDPGRGQGHEQAPATQTSSRVGRGAGAIGVLGAKSGAPGWGAVRCKISGVLKFKTATQLTDLEPAFSSSFKVVSKGLGSCKSSSEGVYIKKHE